MGFKENLNAKLKARLKKKYGTESVLSAAVLKQSKQAALSPRFRKIYNYGIIGLAVVLIPSYFLSWAVFTKVFIVWLAWFYSPTIWKYLKRIWEPKCAGK